MNASTRGGLKWVVAVLVAVGCLTSNLLAASQAGQAVVKGVTGTAFFDDGNGVLQPLAIGTVLKEGDTVKTLTDSTVDLYLGKNGPAVGVEPESILVLETLSYDQTSLGASMDTRLNLKAGALIGKVSKLLAGSRYEVVLPNGVATVRGTEFYISTKTGEIHVLSGVVTLNLYFNVVTVIGPGPVSNFTKTLTISAGQSFFMPRAWVKDAALGALAPVPSPFIPPILLAKMMHVIKVANPVQVDEGWDTTVTVNPINFKQKALVTYPPTSIFISP